ncbi:PIG-L family deacetylase [Opitutus sp. GAS368]|uniref:PIG-L family deacetylase n=1 Tax=Opitutus sp. GAS368 TaxID=1882749 RepID=UPI00087BE816|nr:PIG-L family deacetylase [Opitutus sp. GAS368]SDS10011.1 N-acetylglucosaminyl deacetylase, LmbE family [Opitutus sp. GAS368]
MKSPATPLPPLLAFGAHPDDIEFGAGGIIARETRGGRRAHFVVCSQGEAGTNGTPAVRAREARQAAKILGATIEFLALDGDARLELKAVHALALADIIRRVQPGIVLAPTTEPNQHPDHWRLGQLVRDATRLARYAGVAELKARPAHAIGQLFFYALSPGSVPAGHLSVVIDISAPGIVATWTRAMAAHASQMKTRNYVELQLARARVLGLDAGVDHAQALYPNDPLVFDSLAPLSRGARRF